jgi:hypothetical protein
MNRRAFLKQVKTGSIALASLPVLDALAPPASAQQEGSLVRWDILSIDFSTTPLTGNPGGVAFASFDADHKIKFTGTGSFIAPASGGTSSHANGGGTWETFGPGGVSTGRGIYEVRKLLSWQFANFQSAGPVIDNIGDPKEAANGNALIAIEYSDGSEGILGVGCHGGGAPDGIQEGVIVTKGFVTYWTREAPAPGVDANRTTFHVS